MTAQQLKYWELRWKQHYENLYLTEVQRSNVVKEREIERHNRAQERIAQQQNVLRSIELGLKSEEISIKWEELDEKRKANIMSWMFTAQELDQKERRLKAEIEDLLAKRSIAVAELKVTAQHNMNQDFAKFVDANAKALKNGWGKGGAALGIAAIESLPGIKNYSDVMSNLEKELGITESEKLAVNNQITNESTTKYSSYADEYGSLESEKIKIQDEDHKRKLELYGPDAKNRPGTVDKYGNKISAPSNATYVPKGLRYSEPIGPNQPMVAGQGPGVVETPGSSSGVVISKSVKDAKEKKAVGPGVTMA